MSSPLREEAHPNLRLYRINSHIQIFSVKTIFDCEWVGANTFLNITFAKSKQKMCDFFSACENANHKLFAFRLSSLDIRREITDPRGV